MENEFFNILTENALNERFDKIILNDKRYIALQNKISNMVDEYEKLNLTKEERRIIDKFIDVHSEISSYFGNAAYQQGFKDCASLFKSLYGSNVQACRKLS